MDLEVSSICLPSYHHHSTEPHPSTRLEPLPHSLSPRPIHQVTTMSAQHDSETDKKVHSTHIEDAVHHEDYKTYAEDPLRGPVTVLDTMGQDPDHRPHIPWTAWVILALCALAQFQNVFFG